MDRQKLILDYSKWRCGANGSNSVGEGFTMMLNNEGYSCCLGLFSKQYNVPDCYLIDFGTPDHLVNHGIQIPLFTNPFVCAAVQINDDPNTTPEQKISSIGSMLKRHGIELEVINKPD